MRVGHARQLRDCLGVRSSVVAYRFTSDGWPSADATNCFRFVAIFYHPWCSKPPQRLHPHFGDAHVAMRPWRSWNDSHLQSFSIREEGWNASLTLPRKTATLAISRDLSTHLLEVCLDVRKNMSLPIEDSLCPTSHEAPQAFSPVCDLQYPCSSVLSHPKNRIENT
jgi:hypothetical protein